MYKYGDCRSGTEGLKAAVLDIAHARADILKSWTVDSHIIQ